MGITKNNRVLFNLTEGIDAQDFDDAQNFMHHLFLDQIFGQFCRAYPGDASAALQTIYASEFAAYPQAGGSARTVVNGAAGTIFQLTASGVDGVTPKLLAYHVDAGEIAPSALAPNASGSDRYDLICFQLSVVSGGPQSRDVRDPTSGIISTNPSLNKRTQVSLAVQVTPGMPGSGPPAVPSGWALWCMVRVRPGDGVLDNTINISDMRVPLGYQSLLVPARDFIHSGTWTDPGDGLSLSSTPGASLFLPVPRTRGRLCAFEVLGPANAITTELLQTDMNATLTGVTASGLTHLLMPTSPSGSGSSGVWNASMFALDMAAWCNGTPSAVGNGVSSGQRYVLGFQITATGSGSIISGVRFEFAGI